MRNRTKELQSLKALSIIGDRNRQSTFNSEILLQLRKEFLPAPYIFFRIKLYLEAAE